MMSAEQSRKQPKKHRLRRWHVAFGNPALGTYNGSIVTVHRRRKIIEQPLQSVLGSTSSDDVSWDESSCDSFSSCSSLDSLLQCCDGNEASLKHKPTERTAVMTNVPPYQVPDGVLNLVRSHRPFIEHVRIVIGSSKREEREHRRAKQWEKTRQHQDGDEQNQRGQTSRSRSQTWANEDGDQNHSTNLLLSFAQTSISSDEKLNCRLTRDSRSLSLDAMHASKGIAATALEGGYESAGGADEVKEEDLEEAESGDKNYHLLFVLDSAASAETFVSDLHRRPYTTLDETETCSVHHAIHVEGENGVNLLGPFFASTTSNEEIATSTGNCAIDEHQCPVCLEKMSMPSTSSISASNATVAASTSILTTVCNHSFHIDCLARWQDSPCPVCRYDHSGLNETLSRCHVCSTTGRNYVCLICGVISCAHDQSALLSQQMAMNGREQASPSNQTTSPIGHALSHYEETLHAYALDTETQHVWDFAGGGYVHRLLQNEDGKIVESVDPRLVDAIREQELLPGTAGNVSSSLTAMERSTIPTYSSSAEDDEAIHRKLEGFAGQYYTLLKSQLEQQRNYYEGRLEAIRREYDVVPGSRSTASDLICALKQERNQLEQRCTTIRRKHKKVHDQALFLKNMNETLEKDRLVFRQQITEAQAKLTEARELTQELLLPLEEKVHSLMVQLTADDKLDSDQKPPAK